MLQLNLYEMGKVGGSYHPLVSSQELYDQKSPVLITLDLHFSCNH